MTTKTVASRFRALALVCALAGGALLGYLTLSLPPLALTQDTGITIDDAQAVDEGDTVDFIVTLNATSSEVVSLIWNIDGGIDNPTEAGDFATTTGTVSFPANSDLGATTTIVVQTMEDAVVEPDESFKVTLTPDGTLPPGIAISDGEATGTIANDDMADIIIADAPAATEGTNAVFGVTLTAPVSQEVGLNWTVTGGMGDATSDDDFATTTGVVSFTALSTTTTITVQTVDDNVVEPDESLVVTIATSTQALSGVTISDDEATGTITNDDSAEISIADASAEEGDGVEFTITLSAPTSEDVNLSWVTTGSQPNPATANDLGTDPSAFPTGTASFSANSTTTTITVQTMEDVVAEADESFTVTIATSSQALSGVTISDDEATGTIANDDDPPTGIALSVNPPTVSEGVAGGSQTVTVTAAVQGGTTYAATTTVRVSVAGSGSATAVDFAAVSEFDIVIAPETASGQGTFDLSPVDDVVDEVNETITVSGASGALMVSSATLTLTDDDDPPTGIALSLGTTTVSEGVTGGSHTVTVTATVQGGDDLRGDDDGEGDGGQFRQRRRGGLRCGIRL